MYIKIFFFSIRNGNKYKALGFMLLCDDLVREYENKAKADQMFRTAGNTVGALFPCAMTGKRFTEKT